VSNQNDFIIIEKVLNGDVSAFSFLVNTYKDMALTLAYNIVLNRQDAEEIVQDAFVRAFTGLKTFKGNSRFSTWFYRIVVNTSLNKRKLKKLNTITIEKYSEEELLNSIPTGLAHYNKDELKSFIKTALNTLPEAERICITMYYLNELTVDEINLITGFSQSNIKVLLFRGRKDLYHRLKDILKDEIHHLI
jgi:RNA polymerase sigma-70 factor (ECF subfamily)